MKVVYRWLVGALVICGVSTAVAADNSLQRVKQAGVLKVCTTGDYPPLTAYVAGKYQGQAIQAAQSLARYLGVKLQFVKVTWPTLSQSMVQHRCDIAMGGISITPAREKQFLLSTRVTAFGKSALVRCGQQRKYDSLQKLNQPTVRVVENAGGTNEKFARKALPKAHLIIVKNNHLPFVYLQQGKADVMITDNLEAVYRQKTTPGLCAVNPKQPYTTSYKAYMLPKSSRALLQSVNLWLSHSFKERNLGRLSPSC